MKSPYALLLPLFIHHTNSHTHRSMVNVFAKELGEGNHCCCGTGPRRALRKVFSAQKKNRQRHFLACPASYSLRINFETLKLGKRLKGRRKAKMLNGNLEWKKKNRTVRAMTCALLKRLTEESGKLLKQMGNVEGGRVRKKADAERDKEAIYLMQCACKSGV